MSESKAIHLWDRAVLLPCPVLESSELTEETTRNHLLLPYDLSKPDGYQDPSEYNSLMLMALVGAYAKLGPTGQVMLADGRIKAFKEMTRMILYPGMDDVTGRCGAVDSRIMTLSLAGEKIESSVAERMVVILRKAVNDPLKLSKMIDHLMLFAYGGLPITSTTDNLTSTLITRLQQSKTFCACPQHQRVLEILPDLAQELINKSLYLEIKKSADIRKEVLPWLIKAVDSRYVAPMLVEFTRTLR